MSEDIYVIVIRSEPRELCKILKDKTESCLYDDFAINYISNDLNKATNFYNAVVKQEKKYWRSTAKYLIQTKLNICLDNGLMQEKILINNNF